MLTCVLDARSRGCVLLEGGIHLYDGSMQPVYAGYHNNGVTNTCCPCSCVQCYALGLGTPIAISAENGVGLGDLYNIMEPYACVPAGDGILPTLVRGTSTPEDDPERNNRIQVAIVGRPNVGKSTLVNQILG